MKTYHIRVFILLLIIIVPTSLLADDFPQGQIDSLKFNKSVENIIGIIEDISVSDSSLKLLTGEINNLKKTIKYSNKRVNYFKDIIIPFGLAIIGFLLGRANSLLNYSRYKKHLLYSESTKLLDQVQKIKDSYDYLAGNKLLNTTQDQILPELTAKFQNIFLALNRPSATSREFAFNPRFKNAKKDFSHRNANLLNTAISEFLILYNYKWLRNKRLSFNEMSFDNIIEKLRIIKADNTQYKKLDE